MLVLIPIAALAPLAEPGLEIVLRDRKVVLVLDHREVDADWRPLPNESVRVEIIGQRVGNHAAFDSEAPAMHALKGGHPITDPESLAHYQQEARFLVEALQELRPKP